MTVSRAALLAGFVEALSEHGNFAGTSEVAEHVGRVERAIEGGDE
jgi:hypothetical protein